MTRFFIESKARKYVKGYGFLSFSRNLYNKYRKQLLDTGINTSKKVIHKAAEATGEFLRNKIADAVSIVYRIRSGLEVYYCHFLFNYIFVK